MMTTRQTIAAGFAAAAMTIGGASMADIIVWSDADTGDSNWSTGGNWVDGAAPGSGDTAEFAQSGSGSSQVDLDGNQTIAGITFNGNSGNFTIGGSSGTLYLEGGDIDITTTGANTYEISRNLLWESLDCTVGADGELFLSGGTDSSGGNQWLTKRGTGTLRLDGPVGNNNGTNFTFLEGTAIIQTGFKAGTTIGNNSDPAGTAVVEVNGNGTMQFDGDFVIRSSGKLDWNGYNQTNVGSDVVMEGGEMIVPTASVIEWGGINGTNIQYVAGSGNAAAITGDGELRIQNSGHSGNRTIHIEDDTNLDVEMTISPKLSTDGGTDSLTKTGDGTVALAGDNDYTGTTTVSGGTLLINGTTSGQGDYTVDSGATLGGSGTIDASITVNGTLAPGESIGTLGVNGTVEIGPGTLLIEVDDQGNSDLLEITGDLDLSNTGDTLQVTGTPAYGPRMWYTLATYTGQLSGTFDNLDLPSNYAIRYEDGEILMVPEPTTVVLLGLALCGLLRRRRLG